MLSEIEWFVLEQAKRNNILKKGNLILTGAYGPPIPINDKKINRSYIIFVWKCLCCF